jgi:hypothetical protein
MMDKSGIYPGYIPDTSISQINPGYIRNIFQNISEIYLGYILGFIWDSKAGGYPSHYYHEINP